MVEGVRPAHEASGVDVRAIAVAAVVIAGGIAIALAVAAWLVARAPSPANAPNNARLPVMAGPLQRTDPAAELEAYRRDKAARMPTVEKAMRDLAEGSR